MHCVADSELSVGLMRTRSFMKVSAPASLLKFEFLPPFAALKLFEDWPVALRLPKLWLVLCLSSALDAIAYEGETFSCN